MSKIKEYKGKRWKEFGSNLVIYEGFSCAGQSKVVDVVIEKDEKVYFQQVYPGWKAYWYEIAGYVGELGKQAAYELLAEVEKK